VEDMQIYIKFIQGENVKRTFTANVEEMNFSESFYAINDNQSKL
jgi:hypothetical protein